METRFHFTTGEFRFQAGERRWLTTADVAQLLAVSTRGVRWLADKGQLPCERTRSGRRFFLAEAVQRAALARLWTRGQSRRERLTRLRVRMLKADVEPQQLSLFGTRRRTWSERSLPEAAANVSRFVRKRA